jgi:hypothetical protein
MAWPAGHREASGVVLRGSSEASPRIAQRLAALVAVLAVLLTSTAVASPAVLAAPAQLKAVIIVGPTHDLTDLNLNDGEALATLAESYGMDVRRVFHPNATWANVLANIQGANLVVYLGHGYGWPSPYPPFREKYQNGVGLNPYEGAAKTVVDYHGGKTIRESWNLAPNAIVFLNHLCYAAGQGESGMASPSWDIARQRVDNMASAYLYAGAGAVFAYSMQPFAKTLQLLMTTDQTVEEIFQTPGSQPHSWYGWIGADARYFDSVRTPGARNLVDPDLSAGPAFERAVSGNLALTAAQWRGEASGGWTAPAFVNLPPTPQNLSAKALSGRYVQLKWDAVTVNYFGGPKYKVLRNGKVIATVTGGTSFTDRPRYVGTYRYQVRAIDPVRAKSALSSAVSVQVSN